MNKAAKVEFDDTHCHELIISSSKLGNALLANIVNDKINEKKRKIAKINVSNEFINYKSHIEKLRSLKIGFIHNILSGRNTEELDVHLEVAEKILSKISQIFNDHVLHDATEIISKKEFEELMNNRAILETIHEELKDIPNSAEPYVESIAEFKNLLQSIVDYIDKTSSVIQECQSNVLKDTSKVMNCL